MVAGSNQVRRDQKAYALARDYLLGLDAVTVEMLERHLTAYEGTRPATLPKVYVRILKSAQNRGMGPNVIGKAIGGIEALGPLLCRFNCRAVVKKYGDDSSRVLKDVVDELRPRGQVRRSSKGLWPQFCRTILSSAEFLARFDSASDFYRWVEFFDQDERARPSLPMLMSYEIHGLGFPLACDFLKELGYINFAKPDTHLKKIFSALELSRGSADFEVFKAVLRVAKSVGVAPYNVDKLFWLIGSGNFYLDGVRVGRHGEDFIAYAQERLRK